MRKIGIFFAFTVLLLAFACKEKADITYFYYSPEETAVLNQSLNLPEEPDHYAVSLPAHLQKVGLTARPVERDKAILGRVLFYDKKLSKDGKISCASCHKQEIGFSDDKAVSTGVFDRAGTRNSIALASVANFSAYYGTDLNGPSGIRFFWDNRAETAADQNRASLTNPDEMDMHMAEVAQMVQSLPYYQPLLKKAFGDGNISQDRVNEAIANFINSLGSFNSRFDDAANTYDGFLNSFGTNSSNITAFGDFNASELRGLNQYISDCAGCHSANSGRPILFNSSNGLDETSADRGVGKVTNFNQDEGTFKVPTLRNITLTAPYMHDGRFSTLYEVLDHYSTNVKNTPNLGSLLKNANGTAKQFNYTQGEKDDLVAFLSTLKDQKLIDDKRYSDPFK